jgi:hypothetical protein
MSVSSLDHAAGPLTHPEQGRLAAFRDDLRAVFAAISPRARRYGLTGIGGLVALGFGAASALAVRLPADIRETATPDQTVVLDELPAAAAARAFALSNPPTLMVAEPKTPQDQVAGVDSLTPGDDAEPAVASSDDKAPDGAATPPSKTP